MKEHKCGVCGSSRTRRLTGEDVDFMGHRTLLDEEHGWTYLSCLECGIVVNWWRKTVVSYDLSQISALIKSLEKVKKY